jgi:hypothetical protein
MTIPSIVRILAVRDTRNYEEQGDRWIAVPGSGQERECDRCRRPHEVHVDVELSDGTVACIGRGCAQGDSMEAPIGRAVTSEITRARLEHQLSRARAELTTAERTWTEVEALPQPPAMVVETREEASRCRGTLEIWGMGDQTVWTFPSEGGFDQERRGALTRYWREAQYHARARRLPWEIRSEVKDLARRLARAKQRLAVVLGADATATRDMIASGVPHKR